MVATRTAASGASTAGINTLETTPTPLTASKPAAMTVAPMTPPISACEELDGMPRYHVRTFQKRPPIRPANTTVSVMASASTMPLAIVAATVSDSRAPMKLSTAAIPTAMRGFSAPVAIDVAIALPVSWNPFVKVESQCRRHNCDEEQLCSRPTLVTSGLVCCLHRALSGREMGAHPDGDLFTGCSARPPRYVETGSRLSHSQGTLAKPEAAFRTVLLHETWLAAFLFCIAKP